MRKVVNLIFHIFSIAGFVLSVVLIIMGNQPCSGDGCIIHVLYIIGAITLVISAIIFLITKRNINKAGKNKE